MLKRTGRCGWMLVLGLSACTGSKMTSDADTPRQNDLEGELCPTPGVERACGAEDEGTQFCADWDDDADHAWGECLDEVACTPGERKGCDAGLEITCILEAGEPVWEACPVSDPVEPDGDEPADEDTPLVLVFPGEALTFEPATTSTFAIAGECITHDWPSAATPWLAIDLDRNGSIDSGAELFGSGTTLRDGARATNGFAALAELDSNGDGFVTPADERFADLILWSDHDGDRRSTHAEHESLSSRGIVALPVRYTSSRECDDRGNCAIERASVPLSSSAKAELVDVHLPCQ